MPRLFLKVCRVRNKHNTKAFTSRFVFGIPKLRNFQICDQRNARVDATGWYILSPSVCGGHCPRAHFGVIYLSAWAYSVLSVTRVS